MLLDEVMKTDTKSKDKKKKSTKSVVAHHIPVTSVVEKDTLKSENSKKRISLKSSTNWRSIPEVKIVMMITLDQIKWKLQMKIKR